MNPVSRFKPFWCHSCRRQILLNSASVEVRCSNCQSDLIEEVENFDHHPSRFVPQGLEPQRRQVSFVQIFTHTWLAGHSGAPPASQSDLGMLEEVDVDGGECAICQEDLGENCRRMRCGHIYHFQCLMPWLGIHNTCPVCRLPIV